MLIRDVLHPRRDEGRIALHRLNAVVVINKDGIIDPEKATKIRPDGPKPDASNICAQLLRSSRYQQFKLKQPKAPVAVAAPAPTAAPAAPPATAEAAPAEGGNGEGSLPATPQTGDLETLNAVLATKKVTELSVGEIEAALNTGKVLKDRAMSWLAQESARKPKKKQRKTLLLLLERHIKKAA